MRVCYLVLWAVIVGLSAAQPGSPLYEYVNRDDGEFTYTEIAQYVQDGFTSYVYNMTSQRWFDMSWSDQPIWSHHVTVHIPDNPNPDFLQNGFILIGSGSWDSSPPDPGNSQVRDTGIYCNRTGMVTAAIRQVPFQPIIYTGDETQMERSEDESIAWTWSNFLEGNTADPETLLRFPMVKAVSKAFDLMTEVAAEKTANQVTLTEFMAAGSSKRGWTTWLMPAADERVVAIAPIVLSCLNLNSNMHHYWRSFGNWTFVFEDYWNEQIPTYMDDPRIFPMLDLIDPYEYRDVLTLPKLMISGASDEFFMPDDYDYFYDDLLGEKYIWLLENTGHSVGSGPLNEDVWRMLETFYISVIKNRPRPTFTWQRFTDTVTGAGYIEVTLDEPADSVVAWMADTPPSVAPRRDFRTIQLGADGGAESTGVEWFEYPASDLGGNTWRVDFEKPETGYRAFFLKLTFPYAEEDRVFTFSSAAHILSFDVDNEFPYPDCTLAACQGSLV